jgi:hypothetical protein
MPSAITGGYVADCSKDNIGGLKVVKIASKCDIKSITKANGVVTAIQMNSGTKFYEFQLVKQTSNFVITPTVNAQNGTAFYAEALTIVFNKLKSATSTLVDGLVKGSIVAIVEDRNGEAFLLGRSLGMDLSGGTIGSGTASGDRNGYELQFHGEESEISHIDPTIIPALLNAAL